MNHRVLVFGGTFDPVHNGHLTVARRARTSLPADRLWLIPTNVAPHRPAAQATPSERAAMVALALRGQRHTALVDVEVARGGTSYTFDTWRDLSERHREDELWLLLGADAARGIATWHRAAELLEHARFAIVNRAGVPELGADEARGLGFTSERSRLLRVDSPPITASDIRGRVSRGESIVDLVPAAVADFIAAANLYRT